MTAVEFRAALLELKFSQRRFAATCGIGERTVRRWASGDQDIPLWVAVMLRLMHQRDPHDLQGFRP